MLYFHPLAEFNFHHALAATAGPVLVMFSTPGCSACRKVEKLLPGVVADLVGGLYKVDVQQNMGLVRAYEVFHLPALFLFVDGRYHAPIESEVTAVKMQQALEQALSAPPQDEP